MNLNYRNNRNADITAKFWDKSLDDREWYAIKHDGDTAEIMIYDVIGWPWIDAATFVRELNGIDAKNIVVGINSPGGDVFDGIAIYNALKAHPANVTTRNDGLAASMASIIMLAGDSVEMAKNAFYMIHNPWTIALGDANELRKTADFLGKIEGVLAETYTDKTGDTVSHINKMMSDETWMTASEAKDQGFIDSIVGEVDINSEFNMGVFDNAPKGLTDGKPEVRKLESALRDAGLSRTEAKAVLSNGYQRDADLTQIINNVTNSLRTKT